jgi:hypothetical protein
MRSGIFTVAPACAVSLGFGLCTAPPALSPDLPIFESAWPMIAGAYLVALAPLLVLLPLRWRGRPLRWSALSIPLAALGVWLASTLLEVLPSEHASPAWWGWLWLYRLDLPTPHEVVAIVVALAVATAALLRPLEPGEATRHVLVAVAALVALATLHTVNVEGYWACFSPPDPAYGAARNAIEPLVGRLALDSIAAIVVLAAMYACAPLRRVHLAVLLFLGARIVPGAIEIHADRAIAIAEGTDGVPLGSLALAAELIEHVGLLGSAALAALLMAGFFTRDSSWARLRRAARSLWPLLPLPLAMLSPRLGPPLKTGFPQQRPRAVWAELGIEPLRAREPHPNWMLYAADSAQYDAYALERDGRLHGFAGAHRAILRDGDVSAVEGFYGTMLIVDRRANVGHLLDALPKLRRARSVAIAFLTSQPIDRLAARRWPEVEMAARTIDAVDVELAHARLEGCEPVLLAGVRLQRCTHPRREMRERLYPEYSTPDAYVLDGSRTTPVRALVHAVRSVRGQLFAVVDPELRRGERSVHLHGRGDAPRSELAWSSVNALIAGALGFSLFLALVGARVARDVEVLRRLSPKSCRGRPSRAHERFPRWIDPADADAWGERPGAPYRTASMAVATVSSVDRAMRSVRSRLARTVRAIAGRALLGWFVLALGVAANIAANYLLRP